MLRFIESFDAVAAADVPTKWSGAGSIPDAVSSTYGRTGAGLRMFNNTGYFIGPKVLDAQATWIMGAAFRFKSLPSQGNPMWLFEIRDGASNVHMDLRIPTSGNQLQITRNGTQLGSLSTTVLTNNVWYYIEFKVTISDTVGIAVTRINGVVDQNLSSQDTRNAGNATADRIGLRNGPNNNVVGEMNVDDLYICDGTGSVNNDFLGDVKVEALFPNGNGATSNMVGSDADSVNNYLLVDEATPNGDTDYVESATVGDKDTYTFTDLVTPAGTVYGVQLSEYARKTDAGGRSIKGIARLSSTEVDDSADKVLSTSYQHFLDVRETKPGGGAWTISDVNSAEFGVKVTV